MNDAQIFSVFDVINEFGGTPKYQPYFDLLGDYNERVNLVSRETTPDDLWRITAECLAPLSGQLNVATFSGKKFTSVLDIGSGGGFPGIPLMLAEIAESGDLFERRVNKANALSAIARLLGLRTTVHQRDFTELDRNARFPDCLITLRWVKPDARLLKCIDRILQPGSFFLYYSEPTPDFDFFAKRWNVSEVRYRLSEQSDALRRATIVSVTD